LNLQRLERVLETDRRSDARELVQRRGNALGVGSVAPEDPVRVAVALIRGPGVAARELCGLASVRYRVQEAAPVQDPS
jgi:hypothetical protein